MTERMHMLVLDFRASTDAICAGRPFSVLPRSSIGNFIRWMRSTCEDL